MRTDPLFRAALPTLFLVLLLTGIAAVFMPTEVARAASATADAPAASVVEEPVEDAEPETLPPLLSELGLFAELSTLRIADGTESYEVRYPIWIDGAVVVRHHRLPEAPVTVGDDGNFLFPVGSLFAMTLSSPSGAVGFAGRKLETRVFKKTAERWLAGAYVWNAAGTEAGLSNGYDRPLDVALPGVDGPHVVPGRISCLQCHAGDHDMVLGFAPLQLGREQLHRLADRGRLSNVDAAIARAELPVGSENERAALGYLAGNCAHCHNPGSSSFVPAELDLRPDRVLSAVGREAYRLQGEGAKHVLAARDPHGSTLYRLFERSLSGTNDVTKRMPPIGNQVVDPRGREILRRWIAELDPTSGVAVR